MDNAQTKMSKRKNARLNDDLVNFIAKTSKPLSIVVDENFIRLVKGLNKQHNLPCRKTLSTEMIPQAVNILKYFDFFQSFIK